MAVDSVRLGENKKKKAAMGKYVRMGGILNYVREPKGLFRTISVDFSPIRFFQFVNCSAFAFGASTFSIGLCVRR